jgi:hypothetical protein
MNTHPFRLKRVLDADSSVDLDDSLRAKKAFRDLGFFKTPRYGITPYPDAPLFDAIRGFQSANGLRRDGIMKPDGETATRLGAVLSARQQPRRRRPDLTRPDPARPKPARPNKPNLFETAARQNLRHTAPTTFGLFDMVGAGRRNRASDVLAAKRSLAWAGAYPRERAIDTRQVTTAGSDLFAALRAFQKTNGLKSDGFMRPGGETETALDKLISPLVTKFRKDNPLADEVPPNGDPDDPDEPEDPPDDGNPEDPDEPSEPEPDKPSKPDEPEKPKVDCKQLAVDLLNAEQAETEAREQSKKFDEQYDKSKAELANLESERTQILIELAAELAIPLYRVYRIYKRLKDERPGVASILTRLFQIDDDIKAASKDIDSALSSRSHYKKIADDAAERAAEISDIMEKEGCESR